MSETRFSPLLLVPLIAGWIWLLGVADRGTYAFLIAVLPGTLLIGGATASALLPGDLRTQQVTALGGGLGILAGVLAIFSVGLFASLGLVIVSAGSLAAAGWLAQRVEPEVEGVPAPPLDLRLAAKVGLDEALLGSMLAVSTRASPPELVERGREVERALDVLGARGVLDKPESFHVEPPALTSPELTRARSFGIDYEHLRFESGFEPDAELPGRDRWLARSANRNAHAWVVRHPGAPRPWLVCVHGYGMGRPAIDLGAFDPRTLHRQLGLNLVLPVLPLHGPRKIGRRSGAGFLDGSPVDTLHAETQAMWDLRRILSWLRNAERAPSVGVYGLSLGGYNTALLAGLEGDLACAIAGIPATDFSELIERAGSSRQAADAQRAGLGRDVLARLFRVISPLAIDPKVPHERRFIFGGTADRLVPAGQVLALHRHWGEPRMQWYHGSHISIAAEPEVRTLLRQALGSAFPKTTG